MKTFSLKILRVEGSFEGSHGFLEIEAPGATLPYDTKSGWEAEEKVFPKPK